MAYPILTPVIQLLDNNAAVLASGTVTVYAAGTNTLKASYPTAADADAAMNANANPVVLDSAGRADIWGVDGESYKIVVKDSAGVTIKTVDNIEAPDASALKTDLASTASGKGAALSGYKADDTDSVATTVKGKLDDLPSVEDFGPAGDGITDDTTKVQAAITAATTASRDFVYFPVPKTYLVTNLTALNGKRLVAQFPGTFIKIGATTFEIPGIEGTHGKLQLYVATTGSDSTNCGITSAVPFATVQQALDFLPPNINHEVVINIADGTYTTQSGEDEFGRPVLVDVSKKNVSPLRDDTLDLNTKGAKITFRGTSEAGTIFDGTTKTARYGFWVHGTKDIELESMTIQACYCGVIAHQGGDVTMYDVTTTGNDYGRIIESDGRMEVIRGTNTANGRNYYIKNGHLQENDSTLSAGTTYNIELDGSPYVYLLRVTGGVAAGRPYLFAKGGGMVEFDACDIDGGATFAQGSVNTLIISNGTRIQNFTSSVFALDHGYVDAQGTTSHIHGNEFVGFTSKGGQMLNLTSCDSLDASAVDDPNTEGVRCGGHANTVKLSPNVSVTGSNKVLTRPTAGIVFKGTAPPTDANTFYELGALTLNESAAAFATPFWVCTTRGYGSSAAWTAGSLYGSATYNPPSLGTGAETSTTVTVTGAALGDFADASFSLDTQGIKLRADVTSANTVTVIFRNDTGGTLDLGSGTLRARVSKF